MKNSTALDGLGSPSLVRSIAEWLESNDGRQKIQESLSQSQASVKVLNEARTVDPKALQEPVTL